MRGSAQGANMDYSSLSRNELIARVAALEEEVARLQAQQRVLDELQAKHTIIAGVFDNSNIGICITDEEGIFTEVNSTYCRIYGYTREELIGVPFTRIVDDEMKAYARTLHDAFIEREEEIPSEWAVRRKDGTHLRVYVTAGKLTTPEGRRYKITTVMDITEERKKDEMLSRFARILEKSYDEIYVFDADTLFCLWANKGALANTGYADDELRKLTLLDLRICGSDTAFARIVDDLDKTSDGVGGFEGAIKRKDGTVYPVEVRMQRMSDETPPVYTVIAHDMTIQRNLKRKEAAIRRAQEMQRNLNTVTLPAIDYCVVSALYMPSEELGGDTFSVQRVADEKVAIIMTDCTGHGLDAAMDATLIKAVADRHVWLLRENRAAEFLTHVNRTMTSYIQEGLYPTMFAGVFDFETKTFHYANAAGPLPSILREGGAEPLPRAKGFHIGFDKNTIYEERAVSFDEMNAFFFYSDALPEAKIADGTQLGGARVNEMLPVLDAAPTESVPRFLAALKERVALFPLEDDLTFVAVYIKRPKAETRIIHTYEGLEHERKLFEGVLSSYGFVKDDVARLSVCYHEMGTNAVRHGNHYDERKSVTIFYRVTGYDLTLSIEDEGQGFDPAAVPDPTDFSYLMQVLEKGNEQDFSHGRGIWLTKQYVDTMDYNERGNKVMLYRKRSLEKTVFFSNEDAASADAK